MKNVVLFGGSFNPPHWAHRQVCDNLRGLPQFDEVWIVPTYDHPFEKDLVSFDDRLTMCRLMIEGLAPKVSVSSIEGEFKKSPSYMIDTLRKLKKRNKGIEWTIAVGSDCRDELSQWKNITDLKKEAAFYFFPRPGYENSPFMDISSTEIRRLIHEGKPYTKYLVPEVAAYIEKEGLYR